MRAKYQDQLSTAMQSNMLRDKALSRRGPVSWRDVLRVLLALILVGLVAARTDLAELLALGTRLSWPWVATGFLLYAGMTALKGVQYWGLLGGQVSYRQTLRIVVVQNALSNLLASTAGIVSYFSMLRMEHNVKLSRSGAVFIITKAGDLLSMGLYLLASTLLVWDRAETLQPLIVVLLAGIFGGIAIFWAAIFFRQRFVAQLENLLQRLRLDGFGLIRRGLGTLQSLAGQDQRVAVRALLSGLIGSFLYMSVTMIYAYSRIQAFRMPLDFWAVVFITALLQLISLIPIQAFGGLGVIEVSSLYLYGLFGINPLELPAILIGMRILFYVFNLGVLLYLPFELVTGRGAQREPER